MHYNSPNYDGGELRPLIFCIAQACHCNFSDGFAKTDRIGSCRLITLCFLRIRYSDRQQDHLVDDSGFSFCGETWVLDFTIGVSVRDLRCCGLGVGFWVWVSVFECWVVVLGLGFVVWVLDLGLGALGFGFGVWNLGFGV